MSSRKQQCYNNCKMMYKRKSHRQERSLILEKSREKTNLEVFDRQTFIETLLKLALNLETGDVPTMPAARLLHVREPNTETGDTDTANFRALTSKIHLLSNTDCTQRDVFCTGFWNLRLSTCFMQSWKMKLRVHWIFSRIFFPWKYSRILRVLDFF